MAADQEQLLILVEARIRDLEKNMAKASGVTAKAYREMSLGSKKATAQMEADMIRSTGSMNRALAATSTRIGAFGKSMTAGFVAPLAGLLTFTAAVNGTRAALEKFGGIADKSAAAGVDPEFFQGVAYQAKLAGVEVNGIAGALETFAKNAGLAAEGKGRMVSTLKALDPILLRNIQNATTQEERFKLVADALRDATSQAHAAAIAAAAFGDQGPKIVGAFRGGADEIEAMATKARDLGLIVDRNLIARADELGDEFDTVTEIIDTQLKSALVDLAPVLVQLGGLAAGFAKEVREAAAVLQNPDEWIPWLAGTTAADSRMGKMLHGLRSELASRDTTPVTGYVPGAPLVGAGGAMPSGRNEVGNGALAKDLEALFGIRMTAKAASAETRALSDEIGKGAGSFAKMLESFDVVRDRATSTFRGVRDEVAAIPPAVDEIATSIESNAEIFDMLGQAGMSAVNGIVDAFADGKIEAGEFGNILSDVLGMAGQFFLNQAFGALGGGGGGFNIGSLFGFAAGTANTGGRRGEPRGIVHGQEAVIPLPDGGKVPVQIAGATGGDTFAPTYNITNEIALHGTATEEDGAAYARGFAKELDRHFPAAMQRYERNPHRRSA
jgi:hypothetical protein